MAKIILRNTLAQLRTFTIPADVDPMGGSAVAVASVRRPRGGATATELASGSVTALDGSLEVRRRVFPRTLTLTARGTDGSTSAPEPEGILRAPEIDRAIRARELVATHVSDPPAVPAGHEPPETAAAPVER